MIKINLLPHELRPITRTPVPHIISLAVLVIALVFMFQVFMRLNAELGSVNRQIEAQQANLEALAATLEEHAELEQQKKQLQTIVQTIQLILKDRTIWSEHLHRLTALTPDNIWYKRVRLTTRKFSEERPAVDRTGKPEIDPKTGKQKMTRVSVDRMVLEVSGYAIDDETGLSSTATLATNTTVDPDFAAHFQLFTSRIVDTEFNGYPVREFVFEYLCS